MGKSLVICEKPSVAGDVAKALGAKKATDGFFESDNYVVGYAVGHLVEQVDPEAYDPKYKSWKFEDLPIRVDDFRYEARDPKSKKQLTLLHKAIARKDVDTLINACDAGREGELIFKLIVETAKARKPVRRAWFSSMTQKAIKDAFSHLRPDDEMRALEDTARSRSEADWLVGMNASRAATTKLGSRRAPLSIGRVQTPTLAILVRRELEIKEFKPEAYWEVKARFAKRPGAATAPVAGEYDGIWHSGSKTRLGSAAEAERIAAAAGSGAARVQSVERKPVVEQAPLLYDLTALQRDANQRYGFTAERTLRAAQACYEAHKVLTYPRTNSRFLSSDLIGSLKPIAAQLGKSSSVYAAASQFVVGLERLPLGRVVNDAKVTDHHAIIPTDDLHQVAKLTADERKIYDLVARRFLAVFHPDARFESTVVETEAGGELFRSKGKVLVEAGWRAVYGEVGDEDRPASKPDEDEDEAREQQLPPLDSGEAVDCRGAEVLAKQTKAPPRYTDGTLLRAMATAGKLVDDEELAEAMKDSGLGTPATRAATIERLLDKAYVEREGKALKATERGVALITTLGDHVLTSPAMTGEWEARLARMEEGKDSRERFMADIRGFVEETIGWFAKLDREAMRAHRTVVGACPRCEGQIVERPKSYSCTSWKSKKNPGCGYQLWKQIGGKTITPEEAAELVKQGISSDQMNVERESLGKCPTEGCGGQIVERGKSFGCTSWKSKTESGCGFVIWKTGRGRPAISAEMAKEMLATGKLPEVAKVSKDPIGDCPTAGCGGKIVENSRAFGCTSWKSRKETGCGFVIWKSGRGKAPVDREMAIEMLRSGNFDVPKAAAAATPREPIGDCPTEGCGGKILPNSRGWGCNSWKSKKKPGCGFVIWRRPRGLGRDLTDAEAADLVKAGKTAPDGVEG